MPIKLSEVKEATQEAVLAASTRFRTDQYLAYERAIAAETWPNARWVLETILENAAVAEKDGFPLCDDTGIPHLVVEVGESAEVSGTPGQLLRAVADGVAEGLRRLPGRPMAVRGDDLQRIGQTAGLYSDPAQVKPAPIRLKAVTGDDIVITALMLGGGPEIRSRTFRVFHRHEPWILFEAVAGWAKEMVAELGCTPCVPAVGIGRTHYEATCLMLEAMSEGSFDCQGPVETMLAEAINRTAVGALGLGGAVTALGSFVKVGPQRASGVRIVSLRLGCCFDPRKATVVLSG